MELNMKTFLVILCLFQISSGKLDKTWWKHTTIYEVFLQTFKDGNGDGVGDFKGLISKLDHVKDIGVETVYITPFYESPMVDSGYDIKDYFKIYPIYGTLDDFDTLIKEMKVRGLKLMIDMVINHSSDQHPWFNKSINKEEPYTNFYVWRDPKGYDHEGNPILPNNWMSLFGGSSWTWNEHRKQFYYHQFAAQQPDFNLRDKVLLKKLNEIFKFWLDRGVAGFRLDAVRYFIEDAQFRDEPLLSPDAKPPFKFSDFDHIYIRSLPESYEILYGLRKFVQRITKKFHDYERIIVSEDYTTGASLNQNYGSKDHKRAHFPFNFLLVQNKQHENSTFYHNMISNYLNGLPEGATPCWNSENHDNIRKGLLLNEEHEFIFTTMVMMLPGVAYVYYGQEIGATGSMLRPEQMKNNFDIIDPRDAARLPMQWDDSLNAGFSNSRDIFLPVAPNYWRINVKGQKQQENSHYNMFKKMSEIRKTDTLKFGDFKSYVVSTWVYAFTRTLERYESYIAIFNLGSETEFVSLSNSIPDLSNSMKVIIASANSGYKSGDLIPTTQNNSKIMILRPSATLVLSKNANVGGI